MNNPELNKALYNLVYNPKKPLYNFMLARVYERLGQTTSAFSFYLRAAEFSTYDLLSYESLLRCAICLDEQKDRTHSVKGILLRAISLMPNRPEAYFLLGNIYDINHDWNEAYTTSVLGEMMIGKDNPPLISDVGYLGGYVILYRKATSAWKIGLFSESLAIFRKLFDTKGIHEKYRKSIIYNLDTYKKTPVKLVTYDSIYYNDLRYKFPGAINIQENYSQVYQDMFVLTMLNGKRNGSFIDIGCGHPFATSNTALLEAWFDWDGIGIDNSIENTKEFSKLRKCKLIIEDATKIDFKTLLDKNEYDYLQIDCDPAIVSFKILQRIPFETVKFAVITFEHDYAIDENKEIKGLSRRYLESFGYKMIVNNIAEDRFTDFEDWYVHPDLVDNKIIEKMLCISDDVKKADDYMLNRI